MANRPKGKLFALLAIFVAIGLVTATGAFTSVTAERTVSVATAGDETAAFLQFDLNNSDITSLGGTNNNEIQISTSGLNQNATTNFGVEFVVTYPGTNTGDIYFYIADEKSELHSSIDSSRLTFDNDILEYKDDSNGNLIEGQSNRLTLSPGNSVSVRITVDTTQSGSVSIDNSGTILFVANSTTA